MPRSLFLQFRPVIGTSILHVDPYETILLRAPMRP